MKLSEYCDKNESQWHEETTTLARELVKYLNSVIDKDLYEVAKTNNDLEVYTLLRIWLLSFYKEKLITGLNDIGITYEEFQKVNIYSLILSITRKAPNVDLLIYVFKRNNIIIDLVEYEDGKYKLSTNLFGDIYFERADKYFESEVETIDYIRKNDNKIVNRCHEVALYLIKKYVNYKAVTSICTNLLNNKFYHSFVVNDDVVIDLTSNLVMRKDDYYMLNSVIELSVLDYQKYLEEKDEYIDFDESKTLYELLRIALYKHFKKEEKNIK